MGTICPSPYSNVKHQEKIEFDLCAGADKICEAEPPKKNKNNNPKIF